MKSAKFSIRSRLRSFRYAFSGISMLLKEEHNSRIHLFAVVIVTAAGIFFRISTTEWALLIIVMASVFITELLNSAIETLSDFVIPEWNDKIRTTKDFAAAAVLFAAVASLIVGLLIFVPYIIDFFNY